MECRHQRCTMATRCDIAAAEVGDHANTTALSDSGRIAQLQRKREFAVGAMTQGLPMRADCFEGVGVDPRSGHRRARGLRECATDPHIEFADIIQRQHGCLLAKFNQSRAQGRFPRIGAAEDKLRCRVRAVVGEPHQRGVDTVCAGTGDQAEVVPLRSFSRHGGSIASRQLPP
jgi:hypothetical protein